MYDRKIIKNGINSVDDLRNIILGAKQKNPDMKVALIYSDGANTEYLNRIVFGEMRKVAAESETFCVWNYFFAGHGKGIGDSEISRQKTKLDEVVPKFCYEKDEKT